MSAEELITWAFERGCRRTMVTTSFGSYSAVLIHMVKEIEPHAKFVWIDTQYNTSDTVAFSQHMIKHFYMNIYPVWGERWEGEIPFVGTSEHQEFVDKVKLAPFRQAVNLIEPKVWITGIRREQTEHRSGLKHIEEVNGITKVAPLLDWTKEDMESYLEKYDLPNEPNYFDPTKVYEHRECGIHTTGLSNQTS